MCFFQNVIWQHCFAQHRLVVFKCRLPLYHGRKITAVHCIVVADLSIFSSKDVGLARHGIISHCMLRGTEGGIGYKGIVKAYSQLLT